VAADNPQAIVARLYEAISGPAGQERDRERLRSLFIPDARIRICLTSETGEESVGRWSVDEFIAEASQEHARSGLWEQELWSNSHQFGNIAHVFSTYESRLGSEGSLACGRGINSIQLIRKGGWWRIASILFHIEQPQHRIPPDYLPGQ
jgi:hypothetical protein